VLAAAVKKRHAIGSAQGAAFLAVDVGYLGFLVQRG
jgi:hypothetical protein